MSELEKTPYRLEIFTPEKSHYWDSFLEKLPYAHFFFSRTYQAHQAGRFEEISMMVWKKNTLVALLPLNLTSENLSEKRQEKDKVKPIVAKTAISYQGLSFAGLLALPTLRYEEMAKIWVLILRFLQAQKIQTLLYHALPDYQNNFENQAVRRIIFALGAKLVRIETSAVLDWTKELRYDSQKKRNLKKAQKNALVIQKIVLASQKPPSFEEVEKIRIFWEILHQNLAERHGKEPTHSFTEILGLMQLFPKNMSLFLVEKEKKIVAGVLFFQTRTCLHAQYIASNSVGRKAFALDFLFDQILQNPLLWDIRKGDQVPFFFSFGISQVRPSGKTNLNLLRWKEGFGTKAFLHESYQIDLTQKIEISEI
ncbi:hypothetical protein [Hugenholtzia roseola]|uniref:hypothetical protein n=1 Tax=Hugenholtzia roseola TaxID=1002 RepID=UPI0004232FC4|nr:hypothetical protein [Hugenholtzia roseola]